MMKLEDVLSYGMTHEQNVTIFALQKGGYKPSKAIFLEEAGGNAKQWAMQVSRGNQSLIVYPDGVAEIA